MTTIHDIDDPRLTAYALGELEPAEVPAVEAFLADNAEARDAVEATRALAGTLSAELMGELSDAATDTLASGEETSLDAGRRQALVEAAAEGAPAGAGAAPVRSARRITSLRPFLAAAAVLLAAVFVADQVLLGPGAVGSEAAPAASRPAPPVAILESKGPASGQLLSRPNADGDDALDLRARGVVPRNTSYPRERSGEAHEPIDGGDESLASIGYLQSKRQAGGQDLTPAQRDQLRSLGYGAGGAASDDEFGEQLQALGYATPEGDQAAADSTTLEELGYLGAQAGTQPSAPATPEGIAWDLADQLALDDVALSYESSEKAYLGVMLTEAETAEAPQLVGGQGGGGGGHRVDSADGYVPSADAGAGLGGASVVPPGEATPSVDMERQLVASTGLPALTPASETPVIVTIEGGQGGSMGGSQGGRAIRDSLTGQGRVARGQPEQTGREVKRGFNVAMPQAPSSTGVDPAVRAEVDAEDQLDRLVAQVDADAVAPMALAEAPVELQLRGLGYLGDDGRERSGQDALRWRGRHLGGESYAPIHENPFVPLTRDPLSALSTFGVDVDRASYANVRRFLHGNQAPPADAVRLEELVNAFAYDDPAPEGEHPFAVSVEAAGCPWEPRHRLVKVGLSTAQVDAQERGPVQLVFLLDVSGSMKDADKLPLLINSLDLLLDELDERDRVAIVTYASGAQIVLPSTSCAEKDTIRAALTSLRADGSTHASAGIEMAYQVAAQGFVEGGNNRVLLATDGDFNVGVTGHDGLHELIRTQAAGGVFLTVLGFGTGNYKDDTAELLADRGNGQYAYIDSLNEAHRVLVEEMEATLVTVAKDVKVQVEFNPAHVAAYRLLGYENRALAAADFRNDTKDAGEIGAGHSVTALYEIRPTGLPPLEGTADLKYQPPAADAAPPEIAGEVSSELLTVNLRYKQPDGDTGIELAVPFTDAGAAFAEADEDFRFAASVAAFGMILRGSSHAGAASLEWVRQTAEAARSFDPHGDRAEFVRLVRTAQGLLGR